MINNTRFTDENVIPFEGNEELCFTKNDYKWTPMNNEIIAVHFIETYGSKSWVPAVFINHYTNECFNVQLFSEIGKVTRTVLIDDCTKFSVVFSDDSVLPKR